MAKEATENFVPPDGGRDTMSIVQGCLWTLVLCSWSSLHLNVPTNTCTERGVILRKARWMLTAIITPEYVAVQAIRDWYDADWLLKQIRSVMEPRDPSPEREKADKSSNGSIDALSLSLPLARDGTHEDAITGKKPSTLTKEHLEKLGQSLITKPSAVLTLKESTDEWAENTTTYDGTTLVSSRVQSRRQSSNTIQQWGAEHSHYVCMGGFDLLFDDGPTERLNAPQFLELLKQDLIELPDISAKHLNSQSKSDIFAKICTCVQMFWLIAYLITRGAEHMPVTTLELFTAGEVCCTLVMYAGWWKKPKDIYESSTIHVNMKWNGMKRTDVREILDRERFNRKHVCTHIGTDDHIERNKTDMKHFTWITALPTFVFGTCHLLGWHQYFPTKAERMLWRASSINCLVLPLLIVALGYITRRFEHRNVNCGTVVLMFLYAVFRMYMCAEMFAGLRKVQQGVYEDKHWTRYIPHIGT
jgi:hypothetical protein